MILVLNLDTLALNMICDREAPQKTEFNHTLRPISAMRVKGALECH